MHLAWELPADDEAGLRARVRRVTYELGTVAASSEDDGSGDGKAPYGRPPMR